METYTSKILALARTGKTEEAGKRVSGVSGDIIKEILEP